MQAQWNACYATGGLLKNLYTARLAAKQGRLHSLLSNLLMLIKDSPNYKVRLDHACHEYELLLIDCCKLIVSVAPVDSQLLICIR